jgi:carboxyl-terminal processing protease
MKLKRLFLVVLLAFTLSCNTVMGLVEDPIPTLAPTREAVPSQTGPTPEAVTPESNPTAAGTAAAQVYVPPSCEGVPLATVPPATTVAEPTPSLEANPDISQEVKLRVFDDLVDRIDDVYLYPDFNGLDWTGVVSTYRARVETGLETEAFYDEMTNLVNELGDEHSHFESPVEVSASEVELSGATDYVGIGVLVKPLTEKGRVTILSVFHDSAAEHGGLKQHDSILAVDGVPIVEGEEAYPHRVRGPECTAVVLTIQSPGEAPREVTFVRYRITDPVPITASLVPTTDGSRIGYIFIPTFFDETVDGQVKDALESFGDLDGLILDNRMNGGGSSTVVEPIMSYFTKGILGHFVSRTFTRPLQIDPDPINNSQTVPLIILVGEDTVSFGEIFSGALQDIERAQIVGQTTLGNVETLHGYSFDDGSRVWIAEERFDPLFSDEDWEKDGIQPDSEAFAEWDTFTFETDPAVAAAMALLGHE